ncbi:MAG: SGNH/GDSL hydrolase family protein [Bdellovibrionales bacterium]|nr:SGNH/GDSL hydrolase family protein [Bdellovibrionales bacterium]
MQKGILLFFSVLQVCLFSELVIAQDFLEDVNGDGIVSHVAIGDSLTYGVGDGTSIGDFVEEVPLTDGRSGYTSRVESLTGIDIQNRGIPGERLITEGVYSAPGLINSSSVDGVFIMYGTNDAIFQEDRSDYRRSLQRVINVAKANGKRILLITLPPPCCNHEGVDLFTNSYNSAIQTLSSANEVPIADVAGAWATTCNNRGECELYNLPEGLHPNESGYDVLSQMVVGAMYGVNLLAEGGAAELEAMLELPEGTIIVKAAG